MAVFELQPWTTAPCRVSVDISVDPQRLHLRYRIRPAADLHLPPSSASARRRDGLWQHTCAELFVAASDTCYREFNFSPGGDWAAYDFCNYRERAADPPMALPPAIHVVREDDAFTIAVDFASADLPAPVAACRFGLSMVLARAEGVLSYWALAHPADKPDFHDRRGFILPGTSLLES